MRRIRILPNTAKNKDLVDCLIHFDESGQILGNGTKFFFTDKD